MFRVHLLSALYVSPPPIPKQKLFDNNITAIVVNFSEYLFSIPCKYPSYLVSFHLDLKEVQISTLKRVGLVALWMFFGVCWKSLWKVVTVLAVVKVVNRLGFAEPPSPRTYSHRIPPPIRHSPPEKSTDPLKTTPPRPNPNRYRPQKREEPKPLRSSALDDSMFKSFVFVEDEEKKDSPPPTPSHISEDLSASHSFVIVNPDRDREPSPRSVSDSWVILEEYDPHPPVVPSVLGSFVLIDSYIGDPH